MDTDKSRTAGAAPVPAPGVAGIRFLEGPGRRGSELARAAGIFLEFMKGFRALHFVGPCVTVFGSARMALEEGADVVDLRRRVTSPGGTTERALRVLENNGLRRVFESAMSAAAERSRELAAET